MNILLAIAGGSTLGVLIGKICDIVMYKIQRKDAKADESDGEIGVIRKALMSIMLDRIRYVGQSYLKKGAVSFDDRRMLNAMHESYKALGGNGDLDQLMQEVDKLPLDL